MTLQQIKDAIRNIPDFPKPGILFKDITTALKQADTFHEIIDRIAERYQDQHIDYIIGIEARGFIFASALAYALNCGFIPIRKPGKLPAKIISQEYQLEYGTDKIEIHQDAIHKGNRVVIIDDLIAIGGTAEAAAKLVNQVQAEIVEFAFLIELTELRGRDKLIPFAPVFSLLKY